MPTLLLAKLCWSNKPPAVPVNPAVTVTEEDDAVRGVDLGEDVTRRGADGAATGVEGRGAAGGALWAFLPFFFPIVLGRREWKVRGRRRSKAFWQLKRTDPLTRPTLVRLLYF